MRGEIISAEYKGMVYVKDRDGREFVCYRKDLKDVNKLSEEEKAKCLDASQILGDSW